MPVLELFNRASALAEAALCTHKSEDLELAFAGDARGAFLCLQCFVDEEEDWCRTRGCPGMFCSPCKKKYVRFANDSQPASPLQLSARNHTSASPLLRPFSPPPLSHRQPAHRQSWNSHLALCLPCPTSYQLSAMPLPRTLSGALTTGPTSSPVPRNYPQESRP